MNLTPAQLKRLRKLVIDEEQFLDNRRDEDSAVDRQRARADLADIRLILNEIEYLLERSEPHAIA